MQAAYDARDTDQVLALVSDAIVLHTSAAAAPVVGKPAVRKILDFLLETFEGLTYVAEYADEDGVVLLCSGTVGGVPADGVQVLTLDADGLISEFRDFVRPLPALANLAEAAARHFRPPT
jgi:hypothetical protein